MSRYRCEGCKGEYDDIGTDGVPYAHVCPPIRYVRVKDGGAWKDIPLSTLAATDTIEVLRNGLKAETTVALMQPGDVRLGDSDKPRPASEHRDENVRPFVTQAEPGKAPPPKPIKSEGKGRTKIA